MKRENWYWDLNMPLKKIKQILAREDDPRFPRLAGTLLSRVQDSKQVFNLITPTAFCRRFQAIENEIKSDEWAKEKAAFWKATYLRLSKELQEKGEKIRKPEVIELDAFDRALVEKVIQCRKAAVMSQKELAKFMGCSQQFISGVETGREKITVEFLKKLAQVTGCKINVEIKENFKKAAYKSIEEEVVFLKSAYDLINEMVNYEMVKLLGDDPHSEIRFNSMTHQKYFNIILLDFLSEISISEKRLSNLEALQVICGAPNFNVRGSIRYLDLTVKEFVAWLEKEVTIEKIWFPSIEIETNLSIKRVEFIKICGNISKHNFGRLSRVARQLTDIFGRNNIGLDHEKALLILGEFYEWFHANIFSYHSSAIAEFLNNIRWGIYEYLRPEFQKSIVYDNDEHPRKYHYIYPKEITNNFTKACYWDLMNDIRSAPYMRKFEVTRYLKMRY